MKDNDLLLSLKQELFEIKEHLYSTPAHNPLIDKWIPRCDLMEFLHYGNTQMAALEKTEGVIVSKIGKRKFYNRESLEKLLEKHIIK